MFGILLRFGSESSQSPLVLHFGFLGFKPFLSAGNIRQLVPRRLCALHGK